MEQFDAPANAGEVKPKVTSAVVLAGLGVAVLGLAGVTGVRYGRLAQNILKKQLNALPSANTFGRFYYKGGFESKMSKREAGLILGVSPSSSNVKIKEAHKRIMLLNHPDRGGSPYIATKVNEAKDYLDNCKPGSS